MTDQNISFEKLVLEHFKTFKNENPEIEDVVLDEDDIERIAKSIWQNRFDESVTEFGKALNSILQSRIDS